MTTDIKVKALEWEHGAADAAGGIYEIARYGRYWAVYLNNNLVAEPENEEAAKAAAQADYEARILSAIDITPEPASAAQWPIKLDIVSSAQFTARVQSDALTSIAIPMIEELSKRPQTHWGEIIKALRAKAADLWHAEPASAATEPVAWISDWSFEALKRGELTDAVLRPTEEADFRHPLYAGPNPPAVTEAARELLDMAQRIDNDGTASQVVSADELRDLAAALQSRATP